MTDPIPAAEIIAERTYGGLRTVRILCPACGRTHVHRRPADAATPHTAPCGGIYTIGTTQTTANHGGEKGNQQCP